MNLEFTDEDLVALGRQALTVEIDGLRAQVPRLGSEFARACRICLDCRGRIVVTGMGKSGHIGGKIAATLASTGTPAFFVHPGEASHGDVGMITRDDAVLALSNSGETDEILTIVPVIARLGVPLIAFTGNSSSALARVATVHLDIGVPAEACPLNLAPTASTTAALAVGDALAVALLKARGFTEEDFARSHPAGSLGRRLLLHVKDVMRTGADIPTVRADTPLAEGLMEVTRKGLGMTAIVDEAMRVLGVFTDGDLRRALDASGGFAHHPHGPGHEPSGEDRAPDDAGRRSGASDGDPSHHLAGRGRCGRQDRGRAQRARSAARGCGLKARKATPLARIQLLILDVDGVLTDGRLYFSARGEALKVFHVRDGHGIKLLMAAGVAVAAFSGRRSAAAAARMRELGVPHVVQACSDKVAALRAPDASAWGSIP